MAINGKEICSIIKACATSGVSEINFGDMNIKFGKEVSKVEALTVPEGIQIDSPLPPGKVEHTPQENYEMDVVQQRAVEELVHTQKLIDNPFGFEQDIIDGFIQGDADEKIQESGRVRNAL